TPDLEIVQWYDPQQLLCLGGALYAGKPLVCLLPQLLGYEPRIQAILEGSEPRFALSRVSHMTLEKLPVYLDLVVLPHRDVVGIINGIIVSIEDQTARVCAEQALVQQRNELRLQQEQLLRQNEQLRGCTMELERAVKVREELLATMSHELRTPLTSVLGMTEVLYRGICGPLNDEQMDAMRLISENGKHLMALINDILDFAKIDADRLAIDVNVVNIDDMCRSVMRMILPMARKKRLTATLHLDPQVVSLSADERRLNQVLVNLLSNAVKFTPEGGSIGLNVTPDIEHEQIQFTVWDTGIGISDADQRRLFQPFVQLDNGMAFTRSGTGLGLALVRRLVTLHEGSIAVQSIPGKGSRFSVSLPWPAAMRPATLRSAHPLANGVYDNTPDGLTADEQHEVVDLGTAEMADSRERFDPLQQPTTILIADDDAGVRETLKKLLTKHSYRLAFAADGPSTLGQAARVLPDLILLDVMLPGMNGFEICRKIRNHPHMAEVPIVMITADGDRQTRLLGLRAGADDFITKPFDIGELEARINTITQLNRYRRLLQERAHSEAQLQRFNEELTRAYDATIEGWTHALDLRDHETEGHCRRVTELTIKLARFMGYPEELLVHVRRGAILHDIGKIGVPDDILLKPGALTPDERQILEQHPVYAYQMLETIPYLRPALDIPYYHHERWDGTGYPRGLRGENIPLIARIFAVVDVYDALRNDRPYRSGWLEDKVRAYLIENSGTHFDPDIVHAFISMLDTR
ncbi:MAG TPA: HD domain-containing phosphohydrolase, partial [Roseiflexaceae bacterium]|nr:HD domain-containing phosphohydrolase [Roseiflexaceae bacterium]